MAYILFVNPRILGQVADRAGTQLGFTEVLSVTALVAGVATIAMGLFANYPFALAAGLGLNVTVTFGLVATNGLTWPQAMGVIVAEGVLITVFVLTGLREFIMNAIPMDLKRSIGIRIGLFIALIGLANAGVVVAGPQPPILAIVPPRGRLRGVKRVLLIDSLAAVGGGAASASSNTTFIESASGVSEGGRTGLTAVVVGVLFLVALFLSPIAGIVPSVATAPILVIVGYFMMTLVKDIDWSDPGIGIPALLTIGLMPFTYSITNGVGAGFVSYTVIAVLRGKARDVHPLLYVVSVIFVWYFVHGAVG